MPQKIVRLGCNPTKENSHRIAGARRTVEVCEKYERPVATYTQAREILDLRPFAC